MGKTKAAVAKKTKKPKAPRSSRVVRKSKPHRSDSDPEEIEPDNDPAKHIQSLTAMCNAVGIQIIYLKTKDKDYEFHIEKQDRIITLHPDKNKWEVLACLLHELGHSFDEFLNPEGFYKEKKHFVGVNETERRMARKLWCIEAEERAWDYGEMVAGFAKIPLDDWYFKRAEYCVETYRKLPLSQYKYKDL